MKNKNDRQIQTKTTAKQALGFIQVLSIVAGSNMFIPLQSSPNP